MRNIVEECSNDAKAAHPTRFHTIEAAKRTRAFKQKLTPWLGQVRLRGRGSGFLEGHGLEALV